MHLEQSELDVGVEFSVVANNRSKEVTRTPQEKANSKRTFLAQHRAAREVDRVVGLGQRLLGLFHKDASLRREARRALSPIEQWTAEFVFEVGDLFRNRRLCDMKVSRSFAKGAVLGNGRRDNVGGGVP